MVEVVAQLKNVRMSVHKVRIVTDAVKGLPASVALARLQYIPRICAPVIAKLIKSAVANAQHNNRLKADDLMVKNIIVNQAMPFKRFRPAAFGSAHPVRKQGCHIRVVLSVLLGDHSPKKGKASKSKKQISGGVTVATPVKERASRGGALGAVKKEKK